MALDAEKQAAVKQENKPKPKESKSAGANKRKHKAKRASDVKRTKRIKRHLLAAAIIFACILLAVVFIKYSIIKQKYDRAMILLNDRDFDAAYGIFEEIGKTDVIVESKYERAFELVDSGKCDAGYSLLEDIGNKDSSPKFAEIKENYYGNHLTHADEGTSIYFGSYEQDNNSANGKEVIEWIVLSKENDNILAVSKYGLDTQPFNTLWEDATWETCTLRKWLNQNFFYNAFNEQEQNMIKSASVTAEKNALFATSPGNSTIDKVYLMSISDAQQYFSSDDARKCLPTPYAVGTNILKNFETGVCWFWLRSPGCSPVNIACVDDRGRISEKGDYVMDFYIAIRPLIRISI